MVITCGGLLVFLAHHFAKLLEKTRVPDVFPLLALGLLLGPVFHVVPPASLGKVGNVFATVTLIIILFQGGLSINFSLLRQSLVGISGIRDVATLETL
jgi:NhaP-type Na+/H+ or K+/H+ antiporter